MIWESRYWRTDLQKFAASLRKRAKQKRWPDAALARCEQTIMVGFFYVRKLVESRKLSRDFADRQIPATSYPAKGKHIHLACRRASLARCLGIETFWASSTGSIPGAFLEAWDRTAHRGLCRFCPAGYE